MTFKLVTRRSPGAPHVSILVYLGEDRDHLKHVGLLTFGTDDTYEVSEEPAGVSHGMTGAWSTFGAVFALGAKYTLGGVDVILEGDSEVNRQLEREAGHVH